MDKNITIKIDGSSIALKQNEFWYFKKRLEEIDYFFKSSTDKSKSILINIPPTSLYIKVNYTLYQILIKEVTKIFNTYKQSLQIK
ncbi:MAG: hypothetical protein CMG69_00255 [Candidatus Marinimicrobia bacterium]|nr:hypothetical protein [Candidatus Neomarinimicrobiota bacterium]|tara:strand:- start:60 stop:314 length:255 start_codon:yes stop_codon:yes gene_type:complete